ncbi:hypothetical protein QZH52_37045 [Variovorax ginsengisoli]|uniref:Uncharacterized protein n=2 Tax=Variovorax ginsengisoli TaxID=363844 RepID=A0ABT8SG41_9BURK|nr:hypothetical protein [Variovorax ginsengisoli]MDO1537852.1 hypothetical protein [Variovorax ginsengisoli]
MKTTEMLELERALHSIELILAARYGDHEFAPWSGPTNLGELSPPAQEVVIRRVEEANKASQERAAIHFCLTSAARLLTVTQLLMTEPVYRSPEHHARRRRELVNEIRAGARSAYRAALILLGQDPASDLSVDGAIQQAARRNP